MLTGEYVSHACQGMCCNTHCQLLSCTSSAGQGSWQMLGLLQVSTAASVRACTLAVSVCSKMTQSWLERL